MDPGIEPRGKLYDCHSKVTYCTSARQRVESARSGWAAAQGACPPVHLDLLFRLIWKNSLSKKRLPSSQPGAYLASWAIKSMAIIMFSSVLGRFGLESSKRPARAWTDLKTLGSNKHPLDGPEHISPAGK